MNLEETSPPEEPVDRKSKTTPSMSVLGANPGSVSETDVTAVPGSLSNTDLGASSAPKPVDANAATITAIASSSVVNLFGQYELLGEVARGGMGVVYRARQRGLDRLVALKMVLGFGGDHDSALQRFMIEARAAASLDHPNVVPIYDSGEIDGKLYFTMALVEGPNLKSYVDSKGIPNIPHAISLFAQIVAGVAHAHATGIIHRDLKPANVLMDKDGRPRVTDFGLAKKSSGNSELTGTGQVMGTPAYMPPEQARDSKDVGPPADVYSLGAILYFLLTGRPPFIGESVPDLLIKVVSENPTPPSQINPAVPPDVDALCLRCLAKSAADRFPDAQALAEALLPIVDAYVPRSSASLHSLGRTSASLSDMNRPSVPGLSTTVASQSVVTEPAVTPVPPPKSKAKVVALAASAGLLAAVALYLVAFSPPKKIPDTKPGDGQLAVNDPKSGTQENPKGANPVTVPGKTDPEETLEWPALAASEFNLKTELVSSGQKDTQGVVHLKNGTDIKLKLTAEKDCYAAVFWFDPDGNIVQLFPNKFNGDNFLKAGEDRTIPGEGARFELIAEPTKGDGAEFIRIVATTGSGMQLPHGTAEGAYTHFKSKEEKERLVSFKRGIAIRQKSTGTVEGVPQIAESEIKFRVNP